MTPKTAQMALQFLQRVQLSGAEVPAYNRVVAEMTADAQNNTLAERQSAPETAESEKDGDTADEAVMVPPGPNGKGTRRAVTKGG